MGQQMNAFVSFQKLEQKMEKQEKENINLLVQKKPQSNRKDLSLSLYYTQMHSSLSFLNSFLLAMNIL